MTRYAVSVGDQEYRVEVGETGLLVNDEPVAFELRSLNGNGLHLFRREQQTLEMYFKTANHSDFEVLVGGRCLAARVDPAHRRSRSSRDAATVVKVSSPMPGLVVDVMVSAGDMVEEGEALLIQESMKMQMQLRAPCAGRVAELRVATGDQVGKGDVLVRVEPMAQAAD